MSARTNENALASSIYWQTLEQALWQNDGQDTLLEGFDAEFSDIPNYIIRITHRIWEQKNIGLCRNYYASICPVHTLGGYCDSVEDVIQNTLKTIAAFPDRSLIGESVIWSEDEPGTYYSSHRITSVMTNKGPSEFGPAAHKTGRVTTIADCVCKENKIVYEWLVRDNSFLIAQLGISLLDAASHQAQFPLPSEFKLWINQEYKRVLDELHKPVSSLDELSEDIKPLIEQWRLQLFENKNFGEANRLYHPAAKVQWPGGRRAVGIAAIIGIYTQWLAQCPNARMKIDHIAVNAGEHDSSDVAIRWSLAGLYHPTHPDLNELKGLPYFVLGATHLRLEANRIIEEWTVFDEVALLANLIRQHKGSLTISDRPLGGHSGV